MSKLSQILLPLFILFIALPSTVSAQEVPTKQGENNPASLGQQDESSLPMPEEIEVPDSEAINLDYESQLLKLENIYPDGNFDISPTVFKIDAGRGETYTHTIYVTSRSEGETEYYIVTEDYEGSPTSASSHILLGEGESAYGARSWITPAYSEFKLGLGDRLPLEVSITIPQDADPGEHYAAVLVARKPKNQTNSNGNNVQITSRIGAMFMINVDGAFKADGLIEEFAVKSLKSAESSSLLTSQPLDFVITYRNAGNVHLTPHGSITVKNIFGKTVPVVNQVNSKAPNTESLTVNGFNVLREAARTVNIPSQNDVEAFKLLFGPYKAVLTLDNGLGQTETVETSFWYLPMPWTIVFLVIFLIIIVSIIVLLKKKQIAKKRKKVSESSAGEKQPSTTTKN